jgi:hypothetical protein
MIVGTSIDVGYPIGMGYRPRAAAALPSVDWVGSQDTAWDPSRGTYVHVVGTPLRHNAVGGATIADATYRWTPSLDWSIDTYAPDLAHVNIITNNLAKDDVPTIVTQMATLLLGMQARRPSMRVVCGSCPYAVGFEGKVDAINAALASKVPTLRDSSSSIPCEFYDFAQGFNRTFRADGFRSVLGPDGTHPIQPGFDLLADAMIVFLGGTVPSDMPDSKATSDIDVQQLVTSYSGMAPPLMWAAGPRGEVIVVDRTGAAYFPILPPQDRAAFRNNVATPWSALAIKYGALYNVPVEWILGVIDAESRGNPRAKSKDGGYGLMQITHPSLMVGHAPEDFFDPELNVQTGTKVLGDLRAHIGDRLPEVASAYNAGPGPGGFARVDQSDPLWGLRNAPGYISRVVMSANTAYSPGVPEDFAGQPQSKANVNAQPRTPSSGWGGGAILVSLAVAGGLVAAARSRA